MRPPHARPVQPEPEGVTREELAELLVGAAAVVLWMIFLLVILPVLVA